MFAGKLRHRVEILEHVPGSQDGHGEYSEDAYASKGFVWGKVEPLTGTELFDAQQVKAQVSHKIILRYGQTITSKYRVKHRSRIFEILSIINKDERDKELNLLCREAV